MANVQKITQYLWFDGNTKEADFYTSILTQSKIVSIDYSWEKLSAVHEIKKFDISLLEDAYNGK
jgi:predicted 3-demethylubiquinone-9 3-methyltransferase (glyoxalase superfamily)